MNNTKKEIPIFFATDDNYIPFLDVALISLIQNASKKYNYIINIINTGLEQKNMDLIKRLENKNTTINFVNISTEIEKIKSKLKNLYHFSLVAYYRLFIEEFFPQYDKVLYLDCDIIVKGDISKLYNINLNSNIIGAVCDQIVSSSEEFTNYSMTTLGIKGNEYINSGILIMNLAQFRQNKILDKFIYLIKTYDFDVIAPDQDYLNFLCHGKIKYLSLGWNKESLPINTNKPINIYHFALYKKPWQYEDALNGEYFWEYAKLSCFYQFIKKTSENFDNHCRALKEQSNEKIVEHAIEATSKTKTFYNCLVKQHDSYFDNLCLISDTNLVDYEIKSAKA